jgi:membrane-associated protein
MHAIFDFIKNLHDSGYLQQMVHSGGIPLIALIVFAETGLLVGFFLPGDTMLFVAGVAAGTAGNAQGDTYLNIYVLLLSLICAAVAGDQLAYFFGYRTEKVLLGRRGPAFQKRIARAHEYAQKYGGWAVLVAKFVPVMRTFVPFVAGMTRMSYKKYALADSLSVVLWITLVVGTGYKFSIYAQKNLTLITTAIAVVSMLPVVFGVGKELLSAVRNRAS